MPIESDSVLENLIRLRHEAGDRLESLDPAMFPFLGFTRDEIIQLMPTYRPEDPKKVYNNHSIELKRLYFYFLSMDNVTGISCREFIYDHTGHLPNSEALIKIDEFIEGTGVPVNPGRQVDIEDLTWNRPCVIAFALEPSAWSFFDNPMRGTLQFPNARIGSGSTATIYHRNQTFYNNKVLSSPHGKQVMLVHNFHFLPGGTQARPHGHAQPDLYKFDLYLRMKCGNHTVTVIVDPGGQNLGP